VNEKELPGLITHIQSIKDPQVDNNIPINQKSFNNIINSNCQITSELPNAQLNLIHLSYLMNIMNSNSSYNYPFNNFNSSQIHLNNTTFNMNNQNVLFDLLNLYNGSYGN
jgi:hypothetical protein